MTISDINPVEDDKTEESILGGAPKMIGIRIHGRGGQGAVIASKILANAFFMEGQYVQAFPSFGMERKGAAVAAFIRVSDAPIAERGEIKNPSSVIVLDTSLLPKVDVAKGAPPGSIILLNSRDRDIGFHPALDYRVAGVDAVMIALRFGLGSKTAPIINTVILGAYARLCPGLSLSNLLKAIESGVPSAPDSNVAAAEAAYRAVFRISGDIDV